MKYSFFSVLNGILDMDDQTISRSRLNQMMNVIVDQINSFENTIRSSVSSGYAPFVV